MHNDNIDSGKHLKLNHVLIYNIFIYRLRLLTKLLAVVNVAQ